PQRYRMARAGKADGPGAPDKACAYNGDFAHAISLRQRVCYGLVAALAYYGVGAVRGVKLRDDVAGRGEKMKIVCLLFALAMSLPALAQAAGDGWISHPAASAVQGPVVLHFRRAFDLGAVPAHLPVTVTADNRFILFVNGK